MTKVITQTEMIQYKGKNRVVFPEGAILTPLAKDFAAENHILVVIGGCGEKKEPVSETDRVGTDKEKLLKDIIRSILENTAKSGNSLSKDEWVKTVVTCLERVGCSVDRQGKES